MHYELIDRRPDFRTRGKDDTYPFGVKPEECVLPPADEEKGSNSASIAELMRYELYSLMVGFADGYSGNDYTEETEGAIRKAWNKDAADQSLLRFFQSTPQALADIIRARFAPNERKKAARLLQEGRETHITWGIVDFTLLYQGYDEQGRKVVMDALLDTGEPTLSMRYIQGCRMELTKRLLVDLANAEGDRLSLTKQALQQVREGKSFDDTESGLLLVVKLWELAQVRQSLEAKTDIDIPIEEKQYNGWVDASGTFRIRAREEGKQGDYYLPFTRGLECRLNDIITAFRLLKNAKAYPPESIPADILGFELLDIELEEETLPAQAPGVVVLPPQDYAKGKYPLGLNFALCEKLGNETPLDWQWVVLHDDGKGHFIRARLDAPANGYLPFPMNFLNDYNVWATPICMFLGLAAINGAEKLDIEGIARLMYYAQPDAREKSGRLCRIPQNEVIQTTRLLDFLSSINGEFEYHKRGAFDPKTKKYAFNKKTSRGVFLPGSIVLDDVILTKSRRHALNGELISRKAYWKVKGTPLIFDICEDLGEITYLKPELMNCSNYLPSTQQNKGESLLHAEPIILQSIMRAVLWAEKMPRFILHTKQLIDNAMKGEADIPPSTRKRQKAKLKQYIKQVITQLVENGMLASAEWKGSDVILKAHSKNKKGSQTQRNTNRKPKE